MKFNFFKLNSNSYIKYLNNQLIKLQKLIKLNYTKIKK
jgi:hypothetical protein